MPETQRRLAAIMFTDQVGYTALTQSNESLALELLDEQRSALRPLFKKHSGREVKTMGDAFLVEFGSALDATNCAVEAQSKLHQRNAITAPERKIRLRIGIHLGDVAHRDDDVYGDAVNIASRIEPLAEPEGICVSQAVFEQVRNKVQNPLVQLGETDLKGVQFPVEVYKVLLPWEPVPSPGARPRSATSRRVAVLPFANMSPDPKDEFFADGMTEELISTLSRIPDLKVISRTSVMRLKGTSKALDEIARDLGAGSVLQGSIRKADDNLRISVQLIDPRKDENIWSQAYDKKLENIFAVQKEIADSVASALQTSLLPKEAARTSPDTAAYTYFLQARQLLHEGTEASLRQSLDFFGRAVERDPQFARAHSGLAQAHLALGNQGYDPFPVAVGRAENSIGRALSLDPNLAEAHAALALIRFTEDQMDSSEAEARMAIQLNPSLADAYMNLAQVQAVRGHIREALASVETAYLLDPLTPRVIGLLGHLYFYAGMEAEALEHWRRTLQLAPYATYLYLTEYHASKGEYGKAREAVAMMERLRPDDPSTIMSRGTLEAYEGKRTEAQVALRRLSEGFRDQSAAINGAAFVHFALGETDAFFDCMSKALEMHALPAMVLRYSPLYAGARKDFRYHELFARLGIDSSKAFD